MAWLLLGLACLGGRADKDASLDTGPCAEQTWFLDADGDGYGLTETQACEQPEGASDVGGDCDDADAAVNPGAVEDCTRDVDLNCDGSTDYTDADGDGFAACEDCDDEAESIHPDAEEICDQLDNDCDGQTDEDDAVDARTFYSDLDGDGFGDSSSAVRACERPDGTVSDDSDCDDGDDQVHPGAEEVCDAKDSDCDGGVGETLIPTDVPTLQQALAEAVDGDALCVEAGTYTGLVDFGGKAVTLEGAGGSAAVTLENPGGRVVDMTGASQASLIGFSIQNGEVQDELGAGVLVSEASDVVLEDLELAFHSTEGDDGGVLAAWASSLTVRDVYVHDNESTNDADVGYVLAPAHFFDCDVTIEGLEVSNNRVEGAEVYSAGLMLYASDAVVSGLTIEDNEAEGEMVTGGAFFAFGGDDPRTVVVEDAEIRGNEAISSVTYGMVFFDRLDGIELAGMRIESNVDDAPVYGAYGPLWMYGSNEALLDNVAIVGNSTSGNDVLSGALFADNTEVEGTNVLVAGNTVSASNVHYGAVLDFHPAGASEWTNVTVHGNEVVDAAMVVGAGWTCIDVKTDLVNVTITSNEAPSIADAGGLQGLGLNNAACDLDFRFGNVWGNDVADWGDGLSDPTGTDGVLDVEPGFSDVSGSDPVAWDLTLDSTSDLVDAGHPSLSDADGSACDIGGYGGPGAANW